MTDTNNGGDYHAKRIAEVMDEGDGHWRVCTGCQEGVDGYVSWRDYPFNKVFRCQPGGGCRECGGLGVIWDNNDYGQMAREMFEDGALQPHPSQQAGTEGLSREALIALIMEETTDEVVADGWLGLGKPNVLVQGCRYIRRNTPPSPEGYAHPKDAAMNFAGFIADRILAALAPKTGEG